MACDRNIVEYLFNMQDTAFRDFHARLIPNIDKDLIIGVRTPLVRSFAKTLCKSKEAFGFLKDLPHKYYEENNLHAFVVAEISDFDVCVKAVDEFLPYVDNWATCDGLRPRCFAKNKDKLLPYAYKWLGDDRTYVKRFGIQVFMLHYLDDNFDKEYPKVISKIKSDEYYVNMMIAWYFATALAKRYDDIIAFVENKILDRWTHNKTVQKAIESYRITDEQKKYLRTLKI